ncbi:MAG TPA: winged helix DNA-binding domain-containing protein [Chloroflexia bacterium]|nr:winged helix DNA-binding domain-containing protein [Chloroflexia bacterium]
MVKELCGIQAQDAPAAALAVRARSAGLTAADVEHARVHERSIVRTWGPRGTLHLLATEDLGWLLSLLRPIFVPADQRRRMQLGLDEETCARAIRVIRDALASQGPLTRAELVERMAAHGIIAKGQAAPHLLYRAALEGIICLGPDRGAAKLTYVLLSDWVELGGALPQEAAGAELARRYLKAYGPATPEDFAAWSGLPMGIARAAWKRIADDLLDVEIGGHSACMLKAHAAWLDELPYETPARRPAVRLLPSFDTYLLGYRTRELAVAPQHAKRIHPGGGVLRPAVLLDGFAVGTWKITRHRARIDVVIEPFEPIAPETHAGLEEEAGDIARFLGVAGRLEERSGRG